MFQAFSLALFNHKDTKEMFYFPPPENHGHKDLIRRLIYLNHQPHRHLGYLVCFPADSQMSFVAYRSTVSPLDCPFECRCKRCVENKGEDDNLKMRMKK